MSAKPAPGAVYATDIHPGGRFEAAGHWLRRHQRLIRSLQWGVVAVYATLLVVPSVLPLPGPTARIWNDVTVFAQFVFWGIWWPGVLISMLVFGRLWCGVLCPEGALSEFASRNGRGGAIPRWVRWPGWPFLAFVLTTVYGQMVSVYQYPKPALLILGGSTLAAMAIGYLYGREKRVWCRYLCPVNGVFGLLAKLAPMHYAVDRTAWEGNARRADLLQGYTCAPLVPVKNMQSASPCHMCGRCSGFRAAVRLERRAPNHEVVEVSGRTATRWDSLLIIVGLIGVAGGAFQWASSPWFVGLKQAAATWLVEHGIFWPLDTSLPWWMLTNYAAQSDVMTLLDGAMLLAYIGAVTVVLSVAVSLPLALATRLCGPWHWQRFHHLAHALIPVAACGVILGLSAQTVTLLHQSGIGLAWAQPARALALAGASLWSAWLAGRIIMHTCRGGRAIGATASFLLSLATPVYSWVLLFWLW